MNRETAFGGEGQRAHACCRTAWGLALILYVGAGVSSARAQEAGLVLHVPSDLSLSDGSLPDLAMTGAATATSPCSPLVLDEVRSVWINEIHYDNAGKDDGEFIEVAGAAGTDLSRWRLVLYNGENGQAYDTIHLSGVLPAEQCGFGAAAFDVTGLQNGVLPGYVRGDGVALVMDPWDQVAEFVSYEGCFAASDGPAAGLTSTDMGVSELDLTPVGESLQRAAGWESLAWSGPAASSRGRLNQDQVLWPCAGAIVISHLDEFSIQGCPGSATVTRWWTARDSCGNSASLPQRIQLGGNASPQFASVPPDATVECGQPTDPASTGGFATILDAANSGGWGAVWINEVYPGGSAEEDFVEIAGAAGTDLLGYALVYYQSSGARYGGLQMLSGLIPEQEGARIGLMPHSPKAVTGIGLRNAAGSGLALVNLLSRQVIQFVSYSGPLRAVNGPAARLSAIPIDGTPAALLPPGVSWQLTGAGASWNTLPWEAAPVSPGLFNPGQSVTGLPSAQVSYADFEEATACLDRTTTRIITRVWSATDPCGRQDTRSSQIRRQDQTAPQIANCPQKAPAVMDSCLPQVPLLIDRVTAADACATGTDLIFRQDPPPGTPLARGQSVAVAVTVSDPCGNVSAPCWVEVTAPETLAVTSTKVDPACAGAADGSMTIWFSGGTPLCHLSFNGRAPVAATSPATFDGLGAGEYTVTIQDAGGCQGVTTQTLAEPPARTVEVLADGPTTFCAGARVTLTAPDWAATYLWSNGAESRTITVADSGDYWVTLTDHGGCRWTSPPSTVEVQTPPTAAITASGPTVLCAGGSVTLTASPGAGYLWSNGATSQSILATASGVYDAAVTGSSGCQRTASVAVTVLEPLALACEKEPSQCHGSSDGAIHAQASGGLPPYQFRLNGGRPQEKGSFDGVAPGSYTITAEDSHGCVQSTSVQLESLGSPLTSTPLESQSVCAGDTVTFSTAAAGSGPFQFVWTYPAVPAEAEANKVRLWNDASASALTVIGVTPADQGTYRLAITDACGASIERTAELSVRSAPPLIQQCPPDLALRVAACQTAVPDLRAQLIVADECTPASRLQLIQDPAPGAMLSLGQTPVYFSVLDEGGNVASCVCRVTVEEILPAIRIGDVSVEEGSAEGNAVFTVALSSLSCARVTVDFATADGAAPFGSGAPGTNGNFSAMSPAAASHDYTPVRGTLIFEPGQTEQTIRVPVIADALNEPVEVFSLGLASPGHAVLERELGVARILDDDPVPRITLKDVEVREGDEGTSVAQFIIALSQPSGREVQVGYASADGTATALEDYVPVQGTLRFAPWLAAPPRISVTRSGSGLVLAWQGTAGACVLQSCDALSTAPAWTDLTAPSGSAGQLPLEPVTPGRFYRALLLGCSPGELTKTVTVPVLADSRFEADEHFLLSLSGATHAVVEKPGAEAWILNDDSGRHADAAILCPPNHPHAGVLREYLLEVGLTAQVFDPAALTAAELLEFQLVVWVDPLGRLGLPEEEVSLLAGVRDAPFPVYFIGGRLTSAVNVSSEAHSIWAELIHLESAGAMLAPGWIEVLRQGHHRIVNGRFGWVDDFESQVPLEAARPVGAGTIVLATSQGSALLVAHEDPATGLRTVTQNFALRNDVGSASAAVSEGKRLFLNSVWWLLRRPICGLTDLAVLQTVPPEPVVPGRQLTFSLTLRRSGECEPTAVVVTDVLAEGVQFVSASTPQGTWSVQDGIVTYRIGTMTEMALDLMLSVIPRMSGSLTNEVWVRSNEREPNLDNNLSTLTVVVQEEATEVP